MNGVQHMADLLTVVRFTYLLLLIPVGQARNCYEFVTSCIRYNQKTK